MDNLQWPGTRVGLAKKEAQVRPELPKFERNAEEILESGRQLIQLSRQWMEKIRNLKDDEISFETTLGFLDDLDHEEAKIISRIYLLQNVHPDSEIRDAAKQVQIEYRKWAIEKAYDEGVYRVIKIFSEKVGSTLQGEDRKLLEESLRDYRRLGMDLRADAKSLLQTLQKRLSEKETTFSSNIQEHSGYVPATREQLQGLEESFIENLEKLPDGRYKISLDYPEYSPVMEHASDEELRKKLLIKKYQAAQTENSELLNEIVSLRKEIAQLLGYRSWNHYVIEERMAKAPERVQEFLEDLARRLRPKADEELQQLVALKRKLSKDPKASVYIWDYYYLSSLFKKGEYEINSQEIKKYFPLPQVLAGMFAVVEQLFGVKIQELPRSEFYQWHPEVRLFQALDEGGAVIGYFYMDLHPRPGKFNHAAAFGLISGKYLTSGEYQAPVSAMVCNFPRSTADSPALIPHYEVETLFHEFGHILHGILTNAKFERFSGTSVARDFVEAPSQVMENWVWDKQSLDLVSKHIETGESLSEDIISRMKEAKRAGIALFYLRQISLALADLEIHGERCGDAVEIANEVMATNFLAPPAGTAYAAGWGHMVGYASGYYGYAWSDVMAADLFSKFKSQGVMNSELGRKLRKEIFASGGSRDENQSLEAFLERPQSNRAFFEDLGIQIHV